MIIPGVHKGKTKMIRERVRSWIQYLKKGRRTKRAGLKAEKNGDERDGERKG